MQVTYAYNGMSLVEWLATTSQGTHPLISGIRYNPFKQMDSLARANGVRTDYEYDTRRRLKRLVSLRDGDVTRRLQDVSYTFDSYDNIQRIINHPTEGVVGGPIGPTEMSYRYDGLNRLIDAEGAFEPEDPSADLKAFKRYYGYAQNGNLIRKDIVNPDTHAIQDRWTYGYDTHQATAIATTLHGPNRITMQYDAVGNLIHQADAAQNKAKQLIYSSENQLTVVTDPLAARVIGRYVYDDQGFRVYRQARHQNEGGQTVNFEVGYPNKYLSFEKQTDDGGNELPDTWAVANHVYLNGVRVAAIGHNGYANYYLTDQVDSVKLVTDNDGSAITRHEYLPYGESWFTEGAKKTAPKFNSQELDKETGYYYYNARHYDPEISRFTTADAVIPNLYDTQHWNRYSYVKGNPIRYKDPTGHYDVDEKGKGDHRTKKGREASRNRERAHERSRPEAAKAERARQDALKEVAKKRRIEIFERLTAKGAISQQRFKDLTGYEFSEFKFHDPGVSPDWLTTGIMTVLAAIGVKAYMVVGLYSQTPKRLPQDVRVNPTPPKALPTNRPIGKSPTQNAAAQAEVGRLQQAGFTDIRVNQQQVNASGQRVGINRPDIQATSPRGQRVHIEYDTSISNRGPLHRQRIIANDPNSQIILRTVN